MNILAIDTSFSACSVALQVGDEVKSLHQIAPMQQAQLIIPLIHSLLESAFLSCNQLDAIAYGCGPGSFTGVRIAASVAQGIGFASQLPIVPISSLAAAAQAAFMTRQWTRLLVAFPAQKELIYWAIYEAKQTDQVELWGEEKICTPEEVNTPVNLSQDWYGIGDGWEKYEERLAKGLGLRPIAVHSTQLPTAQAVLRLSRSKIDQREWVTASDAVPVYLR